MKVASLTLRYGAILLLLCLILAMLGYFTIMQAYGTGRAYEQALIDKDPARYAPEPRLSFEQVYLGGDSTATRGAASEALARLASGGAVAGVPVGLQLVGRRWQDEALLQVGAQVEAALGPWQAPPDPDQLR